MNRLLIILSMLLLTVSACKHVETKGKYSIEGTVISQKETTPKVEKVTLNNSDNYIK